MEKLKNILANIPAGPLKIVLALAGGFLVILLFVNFYAAFLVAGTFLIGGILIIYYQSNKKS